MDFSRITARTNKKRKSYVFNSAVTEIDLLNLSHIHDFSQLKTENSRIIVNMEILIF